MEKTPYNRKRVLEICKKLDSSRIWWHGQNSGKIISVYILAPDENNTAIAYIGENWSGWRKIVLPFASFELYGEPAWDNVNYLRIGMYGSLKGTWNLDNVVLEALEAVQTP